MVRKITAMNKKSYFAKLKKVNKYFIMWILFAISKIYWIYLLPALVIANLKTAISALATIN